MTGDNARRNGRYLDLSDVETRAGRLDRKAEMFDEIGDENPLLQIEATEAALMARVEALRLRRSAR